MSDAGAPSTTHDPAGRLLSLWRQGSRPDLGGFLAAAGPLSPGQAAAVLRVDQCLRWEAGERVPCEAYLAMHPALAAGGEEAFELIYGEFLLREERGESPEEDLLHRFPGHADRLRQQVELHRAVHARDTVNGSAGRPAPVPPAGAGRPSAAPALGQSGAGAPSPAGETTDDVVRVKTRDGAPPLGRIGRFELRAVLGQGGFGRVYRAYDPQLDRQVALKVPRFAPDEGDQVERFLGEAKAAARLRHPNLVAVFESGRDGDDYYIVSEFVEGLPLSERLRQDPPDFRQSAAWVRAVARALAYAHAEGVIHRDIKSANVLIDRDGRSQLTDFGLAKRVGDEASRTVEGAILGTPAYMAPEQARGDLAAVGPQSDQFSLGVVLYELLAGRLPFDGSPHEVLLHVVADDPPPPSRFRPAMPRDLEAICLKATAKEPTRRYATAAELADDLDRWLEGAPIRARRPGWRERAGRWLRRRRQVVFLAAGVVAAVGVTLALVWLRGGFRNPPPASSAASAPGPEDATRIADRAGKLKAVGMAIQSYQTTFGYFPKPAIFGKGGEPLLSWRVAILPYLGHADLYKRFNLNEPWDSRHNLELLQFMPEPFQAPGDPSVEAHKTYFQAFVGPGAVFDPDPNPKLHVKLMDVRDAHDSTLLIGEAAEPVEWTKPADLVVEPGKPLPRLGGLSPDVWLAVFADDQVRYLKPEICLNETLLRAMISRDGNELFYLHPYIIDPRAAPPAPAKETPAKDTPPEGQGPAPAKDPPRDDQDPKAAARARTLRRVAIQNRLALLSRALQSYAGAHGGTLPPPAIYGKDGQPVLSWRVALLPYLNNQNLYGNFKLDQAWDGPDNKKLLKFMPPVFGLPDVPPQEPNTTHYQLFVGPGAYEPGPGTKRRTLAAVGDGLSHTMAIAEGAKAVPWTAPEDLPFPPPDEPLPGLGAFPEGFTTTFFDGSVRFFKHEIYKDDKALRALIGWNDGECVNLRPYEEPSLESPTTDTLRAAAVDGVRRTRSQFNLKQLSLALHQYHNAHGAFPPYAIADKDGSPLLSWRVAILPYLEEEALFKKFKLNEAWNSENNKKLLPMMPRVFDLADAESASRVKTFYQVFVGPGAGFEPDPKTRVRVTDVRNGGTDALLVVEGGKDVFWTAPEDLFIEPDQLPTLGGLFVNGFNACTFDGKPHFVGAAIYQDPEALRELIKVGGDKRVDIESYR